MAHRLTPDPLDSRTLIYTRDLVRSPGCLQLVTESRAPPLIDDGVQAPDVLGRFRLTRQCSINILQVGRFRLLATQGSILDSCQFRNSLPVPRITSRQFGASPSGRQTR